MQGFNADKVARADDDAGDPQQLLKYASKLRPLVLIQVEGDGIVFRIARNNGGISQANLTVLTPKQ